MCAGYSFSSQSVLVKAQQGVAAPQLQIYKYGILTRPQKSLVFALSLTVCVLSEYCVLSETVERVTAGPEDGSSI